MGHPLGLRTLFDLFESTGIGLVALDGGDRIIDANRNVAAYLGLEAQTLVGADVRVLAGRLRSAEFWAAWPGTFYCLAPGPDNLLLVVSRALADEGAAGLRRAIILRPYSLEREFARMRVCINNYLAHEIAANLGSIGIASEFITEPELRRSGATREAFLTSFRHDIGDLSTLFVQLLESAEPLALPNRVAHARIDWRALVEDLAAKIRGLASERSVTLSCLLPPQLPQPQGDYHWLYLALFGALAHALREASPLTEVRLAARAVGDRLETTITSEPMAATPPEAWPPPSLFPLPEDNPRIGRIMISEAAVTRAILLLHGGDLAEESAAGSTRRTVVLPL